MKIILIFILVFTVLIPGAFAQTLNFTGVFLSGMAVHVPDQPERKPTFMMWSPADGISSRVFLWGRYTNALGNFGTHFELRGDAPFEEAGRMYFQAFFGWAKFWKNRFTIMGGKLDANDVFRMSGGIDEDNMVRNDVGLHLRIENIPRIPNLSLGMTFLPGRQGQFEFVNAIERASYRFAGYYHIPGQLGMLGLFFVNYPTDVYQQLRLHGLVGVDIYRFRAQGVAHFRMDVAAYDIQDSEYINMKSGLFLIYRTGNWEFGTRLRQVYLLGSAKNDLPPDHRQDNQYSMEHLYRLWATYAMRSGTIRPRLEIGYMAGGNPLGFMRMRMDGYEALNGARSIIDPTQPIEVNKVVGLRKNADFLAIIPQIELRPVGSLSTAIAFGGGPLFHLVEGQKRYEYQFFTHFRINF